MPVELPPDQFSPDDPACRSAMALRLDVDSVHVMRLQLELIGRGVAGEDVMGGPSAQLRVECHRRAALFHGVELLR